MKQKVRNQIATSKKAVPKKVTTEPKGDTDWKWFDYFPWFLLAGLLLLIIIIRSNFSEVPFERDEGDYFYIAQLILDGKIPYIDFYEQKFPGLFYSYGMIISLFGATIKGAHTGFLVINVLTTLIMFFIGRRLFNNMTAFIVAASFALLSLTPHMSGFTTQSEHLVIFYASGGFLALIYALKNPKLWYLLPVSGLLLCFSFLVKQSGIFFILAGGAGLLLHLIFDKPVKWKGLMIKTALYSAGVLIALLIMFIVLYKYNVFKGMYYWTFVFAKNYISEFPWSEGKKMLGMMFTLITDNYLSFWILAALGLVLVFFTKKPRSFALIIWVVALFSCFTIVPGLRFYGHYWIQLTPILAILIGTAFFGLFRLLQGKLKNNYLNLILLSVFLLVAVRNLSAQKLYYFEPDSTKLLKEVYGDNPFPESKVIGDYIKARTTKNDCIAVLGSEPQIYFYTDRRCVSKHHYIAFIMGDTAVFPDNKRYQQEFIRDIETKKPKYLVYYKFPVSWLRHPAADKSIDTWFSEFSKNNYDLVGLTDMISQEETNYVWEKDIPTYSPKGEFLIGIFERKNGTTTTHSN